MWVLLGPFDGEAGDSGFQKPKLLKPNTSYTVGRKDRPLLVNNKKISHDHCDFVVGPHSVEDVSKPSVRPTLKLINWSKKDKSILISRNDNEVNAYPSSEELLLEGDIVTLISGIHVTVKWIPICAYTTMNTFRVEDCASLGIKLVYTPHSEVTHHITTHYMVDLPCSMSLLSLCQFVKPEWLQEVIRLGMLSSDQSNGIPLQDHFALPQENKYRPDFGTTLMPAQKKLNVWVPNEERVNLFRACRFICLHEKTTTADTELREVLHRGGGLLEIFDIHSGIQKFRRALSRSQAKEGKKTVVVGDLDSMQLAMGMDNWKEFIAEARSTSVPVVSLSKIIQAILDAKIEALVQESGEQDNDPLDELMSNPPSATQASRSRLVRRVNSRAASREPSVGPESVGTQDQEPAVPRRALTRRVVKSTTNEGQSNARKTPPPELIDLTAPTPKPTRLKRRFGLTKETKEILTSIEETVHEPPLKKFKSLFESTNPESMGIGSDGPIMDDAMDAAPDMTQTQTDMGPRSLRSLGNSSLTILREEEEETQINVPETSLQRGKKRRISSEDDVEEQIVDEDRGDTTSEVAEPPNKRRAMEIVNTVPPVVPSSEETTTMVRGRSKPPSKAGLVKGKTIPGAPPGKPDTDDAFLKAIASTKRGKKNEDEFDREFNKLKITKPELDRHDPEEEWDVLADFGDDSGLRGNFMVIVEIDPYERERGPAPSGLKEKSLNCKWDQRPNFKKFKKKATTAAPRQKIELFASQTENDYGMADEYWKKGHSRAQNLTQTQRRPQESQEEAQFPSESQSLWNSQTQATGDALEEGELPRRTSSRKPASRVGSAAPARSSRQTMSNTKSAANTNPLFLQSDDEGDQEFAVQEDETLKSSLEERPKPPARKKAAKKPPSRSRKKPVIVVDDDSDDAVFQGFKGKT